MSPRIDPRPPIIAFVFLVLLAVAVVTTSARAVDGEVLATGPLAVRADISGTAPGAPDAGRVAPSEREQRTSRLEPRTTTVAPPSRSTSRWQRVLAKAAVTPLDQLRAAEQKARARAKTVPEEARALKRPLRPLVKTLGGRS